MSKRAPKVKVFPRPDGRFGWSLVAGNGEVQCPGQGYATARGAVRGFEAVRRNVLLAVVTPAMSAPSAGRGRKG